MTSSLSLTPGGWYRQRNGRVVGPLRFDGDTDTRYVFDTGPCTTCWTATGDFWGAGRQDDRDLVEEVREPAEIDPVNHPAHYTQGGVECIEAIKASMSAEAFAGYLKGNMMKYAWRYEHKGGVESLKKARWYADRLIAEIG